MNRALVEEYRAKARSERMAASAAIDGKAAQAASKLAHSYDQLADVHESVLRTRQDKSLGGGLFASPSL
jgi:hypothetical protein